MRVSLVILASASLFVSAAAAGAPSEPYPLTARNKADIVRQVKDSLFDGESARWRWPLHQPNFGEYCGWVNAKNRYGAFTGWAPFYVIGGVGEGAKATGVYDVRSVDIGGRDAQPHVRSVVMDFCTRAGYDVTGGPPPE